MADSSKLVITSEIAGAGVIQKISTTISQINPAITNEKLATFATALGTLMRVEPDYFSRTDTTIISPDDANENQQRIYLRKKESMSNVEETRTAVLNE